jgi:WD40 repeat protein/serine/threonine protein kinase/two-component SAPR family response regulator
VSQTNQDRVRISRLSTKKPEDSLRLGLLGPLSVSRNGSALELSGPKRRALLILLAIHAGEPVSVDRIVEALWPNGRTGREESTLRVHVSHVRDVLEPGRDGNPRVLLTHGSAYMLSPDEVEIDSLRFHALTTTARAEAESHPEIALDMLNEALSLWRGRALQDVEYEEFAQEEIRRLEQARSDAIEDRAEVLIELNEDSSAIDDLESLIRTHPTTERPAQLLMRALYRTGRQSEALRVSRRHRRHLAELGLDPSPRMNHLEDQILQHDPGLLPNGIIGAADIGPGRSVRGYELRHEAGSGSVGVVYKAFQPAVGREVAVKVIDPLLAQESDFVRRFAEEARIVASLEHPHIVPLHDFWREPGGAFLVMRWMDGGSLGDRVDQTWAADRLARVFGQLAEALGYAHELGVIHRDVKPANVLFDSAGNAYLCDFGLAVAGVDAVTGDSRHRTIEPPYSSPELLRGESPSVASDIFALGVMLAQAASVNGYEGNQATIEGRLQEVVNVATSENPGDRYPDMDAFGAALRDVLGTQVVPSPRRLRRNPYKGLEAFEEADQADFYGRDDVIENLVGILGSHGLTTVVGASGSGKSSVVMAGIVPELRRGALPGSDEWFVVRMVPGTDPFEEFHVGLRSAAVGRAHASSTARSRELRDGFEAALDGPNSKALLVVDQFEELFSSAVDEDQRQRFVDNLVDLATDPAHRVRVVATLRADFSDRPMAHPRLGHLMSKSSLFLAPMQPDQVEEVIRGPAARVGVQVEPGLVAEIIRDVSSSPACLPLLQYVLSELFERRIEDRLTVSAYRSLGGVQGVLERGAEATYSSLDPGAQAAARQLFLRMVHVGEVGEETRRRLPLTEVHGIGGRAQADESLKAFSAARLLTYDRDPITRTPTVEVAHETVISHWARYRIWIEEARADLLSHRRVATAASTWDESGEDTSYLLTGGPLSAALEVVSGGRISLNDIESRFVHESRTEDETRKRDEEERRLHDEQVEQRSRRRLVIGIASAVVAVLVGVLAVFAFLQRQRANDLAEAQERQNTARELAASAISNLDSADPDLSLLLAIEAAQQSIEAGEDVLPEVVDALHHSIINPRPSRIIEGAGSDLGGQVISYSSGGTHLAMVTAGGGAAVVDPQTGGILGEIPPLDRPAWGVDFHFDRTRILTVHDDGVRLWDWRTGEMTLEVESDVLVTAGLLSRDGRLVAMGFDDGTIRLVRSGSGELVNEISAHDGRVTTIDFSPSGQRIVSGGSDTKTAVWDVMTGDLVTMAKTPTIILSITHVAWLPFGELAVVATTQGETFIFDTLTGERLNSFGNGQNFNNSVAFNSLGSLMVAAGGEGVARIYGSLVGGEVAIELPTGGVPLRDAEFVPGQFATVATAAVDGKVRIWDDIMRSELPVQITPTLYPMMAVSDDASRFALNANALHLEFPADAPSTIEVIDLASGENVLSRPTWRGWYTLGEPALTGDGQLVAFAGPSGEIEIVDVGSGVTVDIPGSDGYSVDLAFSPDGTLLAGASLFGGIGIWSASSGELVTMLEGHGDRVATNASSPTQRDRGSVPTVFSTHRVSEVVWDSRGSGLLSAGFDGTVRSWNLSTGHGAVLHEFDYELYALAQSPDGEHLVVIDRSGAVVELDATVGGVIRSLEEVSSGMRLTFSPDGRYLAGVGPAGAFLWHFETGRIIREFSGSVYPPSDVEFIEDGSQILVASGEGILRGYLLDPLDMVELARSEVSRELTEDECELYLRRSCDG